MSAGWNLNFSICRHKKTRAAAVELLERLKDNRDLQKFLQDCQEVKASRMVDYSCRKLLFPTDVTL